MASTCIGTSGWMYDDWRDDLYAGVPRSRWLAHYAERFGGVEVNATHYRLQRESTFERWRDAVPHSFRFAIKAHRYLTHVCWLRDPVLPIRRDRQRAAVLGDRLAVVLWQLPARFSLDASLDAGRAGRAEHAGHGERLERLDRLDRFLDALVEEWPVRHTVELRHRGWFRPEVAQRLADRGVAACISHAGDWPMWDAVTADFVYLRLHGHPRTYVSPYGRRLQAWASRLQRWLAEDRDVYVFFDNDTGGAAPRDAAQLIALLGGDTAT